jgi:hypothetical protein
LNLERHPFGRQLLARASNALVLNARRPAATRHSF